MGPVLVVLLEPGFRVGLELLQCPIDCLPRRHASEPSFTTVMCNRSQIPLICGYHIFVGA